MAIMLLIWLQFMCLVKNRC